MTPLCDCWDDQLPAIDRRNCCVGCGLPVTGTEPLEPAGWSASPYDNDPDARHRDAIVRGLGGRR